MAKYAYSALTIDGLTVSGVEEASTLQLANDALLARGLHPEQLKERRSLWQIEITREKAKRKDVMHFSRQLAVFVRAGIPLLEGLDAIGRETRSKVLRATLDDLGARLRGGASLAEAAAAHPQTFPNFYVSVLRSAELTGNLDDALDQLAEYIERDIDTRRKITSALIYPGVTLAMAILTAGVLALWVLPKFEDFFADFDAELPAVTKALLAVTGFTGDYGLLLVAVGAVWLGVTLVGIRTEAGRSLWDRTLLRLPVIGDMLRHAIIERFCRVMSSMTTAGVPLPIALQVSAEVANNRVFRDGILQARQAMLEGERLAGPLAATKLFPGSANQMFAVGEETGTLDHQLETAARYFDRELDVKIKRFTSLFEPAVILFIGVVVGFVAIAMVSAMYGIFNQVDSV
jgi:type IV pilus assembly protein PilC